MDLVKLISSAATSELPAVSTGSYTQQLKIQLTDKTPAQKVKILVDALLEIHQYGDAFDEFTTAVWELLQEKGLWKVQYQSLKQLKGEVGYDNFIQSAVTREKRTTSERKLAAMNTIKQNWCYFPGEGFWKDKCRKDMGLCA